MWVRERDDKKGHGGVPVTFEKSMEGLVDMLQHIRHATIERAGSGANLVRVEEAIF